MMSYLVPEMSAILDEQELSIREEGQPFCHVHSAYLIPKYLHQLCAPVV
jgi:hypothetical protein